MTPNLLAAFQVLTEHKLSVRIVGPQVYVHDESGALIENAFALNDNPREIAEATVRALLNAAVIREPTATPKRDADWYMSVIWPLLPIPGEFDAMDACDQGRWRSVVRLAIEHTLLERERLTPA